MASKVSRKTSVSHLFGGHTKKWSSKVGRKLFGQVLENLGKYPLHPQKLACSYTYERNNLQKQKTSLKSKERIIVPLAVLCCFVVPLATLDPNCGRSNALPPATADFQYSAELTNLQR